MTLTIAAIGQALLGQDRHLRVRCSQSLLALCFICIFAVVQHVEVLLGLIDAGASNALTLFNVGSSLACYGLIRSGLSARFVPGEPSLTLLQCVCAVIAVTWSYAITGPARGAILSILILILMFGGLFQLSRRQAVLLALLALGLLAAVMAWRSFWAAERYDPRVEALHFTFMLIVLAGAVTVSARLGHLRVRLSAQKLELQTALALNRRLAERDALTGLVNRRAMADLLAQRERQRRASDLPACLALIDIDFFKRVNDTHGHGVGDRVLERFAEMALAEVRSGDVMARWGGEEFLLLMPVTDTGQACALLERLQLRLATDGFDAIVPGLRVTFSAGVTEFDRDTDRAIERADLALYRAKHAGRGRVEIHQAG